MKDKIQKQLDEVIQSQFDGLDALMPSEKEKAIQLATELYKLRIEEAKIEQSRNDKLTEQDVKRDQLKEQRLEWLIGLAINSGLTIGSWLMFSMWQRREMKFEMDGTPTTPMFRALLSKMVPSLKK